MRRFPLTLPTLSPNGPLTKRFIQLASFFISALFAGTTSATMVTFTYTQTDTTTGAGAIAPFVFNDGGGNINFSATPLPSAVVVNPVPGSTPAGFVGAQISQSGNSNEGNNLVGLTFSGSVLATGTRGFNVYTMQIPLTFVPKVTQAPDVSDYSWNVTYGDNFPANGTVSTSMRFAMYMSRDTVSDATETPDTFQRYTQLNHTFGAGLDSFSNTNTTNGTIKDATDSGAPAGTDAAGRDLAFYFGWRDQGALTSGAVLINDFTIGGLLNSNDATLTFVIPEPASATLAILALNLLALGRLRRRR